MKLPEGKTEEQVLESIEKAISVLGNKYNFGCYDKEDIEQFARLQAVQLMNEGAYDNKRSLEGFIYTHIRNRILNLRRNKFHRNDPPCQQCHDGNPCDNGIVCKKFKAWKKRNTLKASLMQPVGIEESNYDEIDKHPDKSCPIEMNEIKELIDAKLPADMRLDYRKLIDGGQISVSRKKRLEKTLREILEDYQNE